MLTVYISASNYFLSALPECPCIINGSFLSGFLQQLLSDKVYIEKHYLELSFCLAVKFHSDQERKTEFFFNLLLGFRGIKRGNKPMFRLIKRLCHKLWTSIIHVY